MPPPLPTKRDETKDGGTYAVNPLTGKLERLPHAEAIEPEGPTTVSPTRRKTDSAEDALADIIEE